ncbi:restriction endonuclease subunit S [Vibrio harveyi]|uniref:restriction endonuclease subunit S n=1 Tax=Vibrio harveyi TaxID=669 RepID=UPI0003F85411|nr:restriction endonuclease subunit S [Vibrio harveyi]
MSFKEPMLSFDKEAHYPITTNDAVKSISSGVSVNSEDTPITSDTQLGVLKTSCVSSGRFIPSENKTILASEFSRIKQPVESGTIIFSRMNTPLLVGEVGYVSSSHKNLFLPDRLWAIKTKSGYDPRWLANYLTTPKIKFRLKELATGTSGSMKNISQPSFLGIQLHSPKLEVQQKIADFLTSVDTKIGQLTEKHRLLKEYKKGVMQQIFSQQIRFKDENGNEFPDWKEKSFGSFLTLDLRKVEKPKDNFLALGVRSHAKGIFQKPNFDPSDIAMEELYVVREDDLVLSITFAWEGAIAVASKQDEGGLVSHRFPTYTFDKQQVIPEFFKYVVPSLRLKYLLGNISPGGAGRNRVLSKKDFIKLTWCVPSVKEQQKISKFLQSIDIKIEGVADQIEQTKQFKKGLLQQMFV